MATTNIDAFDWLRKQMDAAPNDAVKELLSQMVIRLMDAEVESVCGAEYSERTPDRLNTRNGYRPRPWDTRVGTVELGIPKLRHGTYFPSWLLEPRRRAERALTPVIVEAYVQGVSSERWRTWSSRSASRSSRRARCPGSPRSLTGT